MTRALGRTAGAVLQTVAHHRVVNTSQVWRLHFANHHAPKEAQLCLRDLAKRGLTQSVSAQGGGWRHFATDAGRRAADVDLRTHRMTAEVAVGPYALGPLGTNEVGVAFVEAARRHGHDCGPLDWDHEILHRIGPGTKNKVVPDAVLRYADDLGVLERFVEFDRATYAVQRLHRKVQAYARLQQSGAWREHGYLAFPKLIVVFDDRVKRARSPLRMSQVVGLCASDRMVAGLEVSFTFLSQLEDPGPWFPIFQVPGSPGLVDLLGVGLRASEVG